MKQKQIKTKNKKKTKKELALEKTIESDTSLLLFFYNFLSNPTSFDKPNDYDKFPYTYFSQTISSNRYIEFSNYISSLISSGFLEPIGGEFSSDTNLEFCIADLDVSTFSDNSYSFYKYIPIDKPKRINISTYRKTIEKLAKKYEGIKDFYNVFSELSRLSDQDIDLLINSDVYICIQEEADEKLKNNTEEQIEKEEREEEGGDKKHIIFSIIYKALGKKIPLGIDTNINIYVEPTVDCLETYFLEALFLPPVIIHTPYNRFVSYFFPCSLDSFLYLLGETTRKGEEQQKFFGFLCTINSDMTQYRDRCHFTWGKEKIIIHGETEKIGGLHDSKIRGFAYMPEGGVGWWDRSKA